MPWPDDLYGAPVPPLDFQPDPTWNPFAPPVAAPPEPAPQPEMMPPQPGIGIPVAAIDQAAASLPLPPAPSPDVAPGLPPPVEPPGPPSPGALPWSGEATQGGVDAVSGGRLPPSSAVPWQTEGISEVDPTDSAREMREYSNDEQRQQFNEWHDGLNADQKLEYAVDLAERHRLEQARLEEIALDREFRQAEENNAIRTARIAAADKAMAEVNAEAARLAEMEPTSWMDDASPLQVISAIVAAVAGGFNAKNTGGRNLGLESVERTIDQHLAKQQESMRRKQANIAARRGLIGEMYGRADQEFVASEGQRKAMWQLVERDIARQMQNFDEFGTARVRLNQLRNEAIAKQQEIDLKVAKVVGDQAGADAKLQLQAQQQGEQARHNLAQEETQALSARASAAQSYASAAKTKEETKGLQEENRVRSVEELKAMYPTVAASNPELFNRAQSKKAFEKNLEIADKGAGLAKTSADAAVKSFEAGQTNTGALGPDGKTRYPDAPGDQTGKAYVNKDGSAFRIKNPDRLARVDKINAAAKNLRKISDLISVAKSKYGGASELRGSPEYQELKALVAAVDFEIYKAYDLGAPSAGDKAMAEAARGGKDLTSFIYDASPGFDALARNAESKLNTEMGNAGYDGPAIKLARIEAAQANERDFKSNRDMWTDPDIIEANLKDPAQLARAKEAATVAAKGADALARQSEKSPGDLAWMAAMVSGWSRKGILDRDDADAALNTIRKRFRMAIDEDGLSGDETDRRMRALRTREVTDTYEQSLLREDDE